MQARAASFRSSADPPGQQHTASSPAAGRAWPLAGRLLIRARRGAARAAGFAGRSRARSRRSLGGCGPPGQTAHGRPAGPPPAPTRPPSCSVDATARGQGKGNRLRRWVAILISPHNSLSSGARRARQAWSGAMVPGCRRRRPVHRSRCICIVSIYCGVPVVSCNIFYSEYMTIFVHSMLVSTLLS
jgi:hypothetical protein